MTTRGCMSTGGCAVAGGCVVAITEGGKEISFSGTVGGVTPLTVYPVPVLIELNERGWKKSEITNNNTLSDSVF